MIQSETRHVRVTPSKEARMFVVESQIEKVCEHDREAWGEWVRLRARRRVRGIESESSACAAWLE